MVISTSFIPEIFTAFHGSPQVQLTLLTAIVKLFLKKPSETQELVQQVLSLATQVRCSANRSIRIQSSLKESARSDSIPPDQSETIRIDSRRIVTVTSEF